LIAENVMVAIRFGELGDSTADCQEIGSQVRYVVRLPLIFEGSQTSTKPKDLRLHQCVLLNGKNNEADWNY